MRKFDITVVCHSQKLVKVKWEIVCGVEGSRLHKVWAKGPDFVGKVSNLITYCVFVSFRNMPTAAMPWA